MKAREIQIGDWVYSTFSKLPCKVTYLKLHESGYASVETTNVVGVKDIASLSPIPLTPEILEKNGFLNDGVSFWYLDFRIVLSTSKGVSLVCGRQTKFSYIHQLQLAFRLCGIEKEIVL